MLEEEFHELQCHDEFSCMKVLVKSNLYTETYIGE